MKRDVVDIFFEVTGSKIMEAFIQFKRRGAPRRVEVFTNNGRFPSVEISRDSISIKDGKASFWGRPWKGKRSFPDAHFFYDGYEGPLIGGGTHRIEKMKWRSQGL